MSRTKRLGTVLLCVAAGLAVVTYFAWKFSDTSADKAQYNANLRAAATGEAAVDIHENRTPPYIAAAATVSVLLLGLALRRPRPTPTTELPTQFWGAAADGDPPAAGP
jgi:hypothetical protein